MSRQITSHQKGQTGAPGVRTGAVHKPRADRRADRSDTHLAPEIRQAMIAEAAYFRAEKRGFTPGEEMNDWLTAEAEIESLLKQSVRTQ